MAVGQFFAFFFFFANGVHPSFSNNGFTNLINVGSQSAQKLVSINIPSNVKFVVFESHSFSHNTTLSYNYPFGYNNNVTSFSSRTAVTGTDIGLVKLLDPESTETFVWLFNPNDESTEILVIVSHYSENAPLPGGCNLEFPIEISPFLRLSSNGIETHLEYQRASRGSPRGLDPPSCDSTNRLLTYDVYAYFMNENDYSREEYRRSLAVMSDVNSIRKYGTHVHTYIFNPQTKVVMLTYPGRGVVYNVIVNYGKYKSNYVAIASYGCDLNSSVDGCGRLSSIAGKILLTVLGFVGLIVCFRGHRYYSLQALYFGFVAAALISFILLVKYTDLTPIERDVAIIFVGAAGALLWFLIWRLFSSAVFSSLLSGFVLGFLITATILFTTLGNEDIFRSDLNYWLIVGCGILLFPILILPFGNLLSIFSCSIVGSYTAVVAVDRFLGGSLSYIFLNVIKRATFEDIYLASNQVPFQTKDIGLSVVWALLSLIGVFVQLYEASVTTRRVEEERSTNGYLPSLQRRSRRNRINYSKSPTTNGNYPPINDNDKLPPYLRYPPEREPLIRGPQTRMAPNIPTYESI